MRSLWPLAVFQSLGCLNIDFFSPLFKRIANLNMFVAVLVQRENLAGFDVFGGVAEAGLAGAFKQLVGFRERFR